MCELVLVVMVSVLVGKVADLDGKNGAAWGVVAFALCFVALFLPLPFLRVLGAGVVAFVAMMVAKGLEMKR